MVEELLSSDAGRHLQPVHSHTAATSFYANLAATAHHP